MLREEVRRLVEQQITIGQKLIEDVKVRLVSEADIEARDRWSNRNKEILQRAFDDEHYRGEYIMATTHAAIRAARGGRPSRSESQSEFTTAVNERVNYRRGLRDSVGDAR